MPDIITTFRSRSAPPLRRRRLDSLASYLLQRLEEALAEARRHPALAPDVRRTLAANLEEMKAEMIAGPRGRPCALDPEAILALAHVSPDPDPVLAPGEGREPADLQGDFA